MIVQCQFDFFVDEFPDVMSFDDEIMWLAVFVWERKCQGHDRSIVYRDVGPFFAAQNRFGDFTVGEEFSKAHCCAPTKEADDG